MIIFVYLYVITCVLWGVIATHHGIDDNPKTGMFHIVGTFLLNIALCPIAMLVVIFKFKKLF